MLSALIWRNSPRLGNAAQQQAALAGDHGELSGNAAGDVFDQHALTVGTRLDNLHTSREQNEERNIAVAGLEQNVPGCTGRTVAEGRSLSICMAVRRGKASVPGSVEIGRVVEDMRGSREKEIRRRRCR
jgi:hypothetical protein